MRKRGAKTALDKPDALPRARLNMKETPLAAATALQFRFGGGGGQRCYV
ncbi:MAG: hypothetical protein LBF60_03590 [Treponema sp.]|nr:hypothetical protein [Treponema sp.]